MKDNFSTTPYMSSNLREYNRIYKEVNDIYRDAASTIGKIVSFNKVCPLSVKECACCGLFH